MTSYGTIYRVKECDIVSTKNTKPKIYGLVTAIIQDQNLEEDTRMEYISLAEAFSEDFKTNMYMTSIELDDIHPFGMDVWQRFLRYPTVNKYIESFRNEAVRKQIDVGLSEGNKNIVALKKEMDKDSGKSDFQNFVVFRLPDKEDEYALTSEI